jgi:hypothetical protein
VTYVVDGGRVWYEHWHYKKTGGRAEVPGADPATFRRLGNFFGRDAKTLYAGTEPVPEADAATFVPAEGYSWHWGADCRQAYCFFLPGSFAKGRISWKIIPTNPAAFGTIDGDGDRWFARDDRHVYFAGKRVRGADAASFSSVPVEGMRGTPFFVDRARVYGYKSPIPGSVPEGFVAFSYPGLRPVYGIDAGRRMLYQPDVTRWAWHEEPLDEAVQKPFHADVVRYLGEHPELAARLGLAP